MSDGFLRASTNPLCRRSTPTLLLAVHEVRCSDGSRCQGRKEASGECFSVASKQSSERTLYS